MLVVAVTSVDAYSLLAFSDLTCHLGDSDQEASPSAGKNTGVVLVPCCALRCVPTANSSSLGISEVPGCHLLRQMISQ